MSWRALMPEQISVALLDNHPLFRRGIVDAFSGTRLVVVAEGAPTAKGSQLAIEQKPDIVVMEIDMPGDGIELAERILTTQTIEWRASSWTRGATKLSVKRATLAPYLST